MDIKVMIGARIKELRNKKGFTQEQLAENIGINPKYLSGIERGKENPTLDMLIKLSGALTADLGELFRVVEIEDPGKRMALIKSLLDEADEDQIKLAYKIMTSIIR